MEDLNDLFTGPSKRPWIERLNDEQLEWLRFIAEGIKEQGREPAIPWAELHRRFAARWPDVACNHPSSLINTVRQMVEDL